MNRLFLMAFALSGLTAFAQSTTGSLRKDLQVTKALVSMTEARPIKIDGLKASYAYGFVVKDITGKNPGSSSFNLVLGAQDGTLLSAFSLSYGGPAQEPAFATSGQVMGHLARHCLGISEEVLQAIGADFGKLINASIDAKGAAQSMNRSFGTVIVIWQNFSFTQSSFRYGLYVTNTARAGTTGRKTTCAAKV